MRPKKKHAAAANPRRMPATPGLRSYGTSPRNIPKQSQNKICLVPFLEFLSVLKTIWPLKQKTLLTNLLRTNLGPSIRSKVVVAGSHRHPERSRAPRNRAPARSRAWWFGWSSKAHTCSLPMSKTRVFSGKKSDTILIKGCYSTKNSCYFMLLQ